jgi:hypothetical protein
MIERVSIAVAGLGLVLLASMLFRCVIAAQSPTAPAATMVAQIGDRP